MSLCPAKFLTTLIVAAAGWLFFCHGTRANAADDAGQQQVAPRHEAKSLACKR